LDFDFSETQTELKNSILQFANRELGQTSAENVEEDIFPSASWQKCAEMGLMGLVLDQRYGGFGADLLTASLALEGLAYGCKDNGLVFAVVTQILCGLMFEQFGNDKQKEKYLPQIMNGKMIAAQAITEADAGSDAMAMKTKGIKNPDGYLLNGSKIFISNAPIADLALVFAISDSSRQKLNRISCYIIEKDTPGFTRSKSLQKMGLQTLQNGELIFEDCKIPLDNILGSEGQGGMILNEILQSERILFAACHVGVMQRVLETCVTYANQREQFGQSIGKFQAVSHKIADMKIKLELSKQILYRSAWLKDQKKRPQIETSITKVFISESLKEVCLDALQIHGTYGYMREFGIEKELRDSLAATIYSGTSEIHRNIIATLLGL
jgi:alkylation response protein AidB-like acyl-CoA dehydrogenase